MNRWSDNWDCISSMFKFSQTARKVIYSTNAIESLNNGFRQLNRGRTIFPNAMNLLKVLYLATWELTKKWAMPVRKWGQIYAELDIIHPGSLTRNLPHFGIGAEVARSVDASLDRTLGKCYASFTDGDGKLQVLLVYRLPSILAFPRQPAKVRPLKRWLRLPSSTGGSLILQNSFLSHRSLAYR